MRKISTILVFFFIISYQNISANVFASGIKISDDTVSVYSAAQNSWDGNFVNGGVKIWYIVNENGVGTLTGDIKIKKDNTVIKTLIIDPHKGVNSVIWNGYDNENKPAHIGTYTFEINISDPVGHTSFDSLWVAGANLGGALDFDGLTSFAYRGNASCTDQSSVNFGRIYVARGSTQTTTNNGMYQLQADGVYQNKLSSSATWANSTPNEVFVSGSHVYGVAGYGFTGAGYVTGYNASDGNVLGKANMGNTGIRGLYIKISGSDTTIFTARSGTGTIPAIIRTSGLKNDTTIYINLRTLIAGTNSYIKSFVFDDEENCYVAYGEASSSRKVISKFDKTGALIWTKKLDTDYGINAAAMFQALAIYTGSTATVNDDKLYALINSTGAGESGIYSINQDGASINKLLAASVTTAATSQIINVDAAGNIIWSNGAASERISAFAPASGPNSFTTKAPEAALITVTAAVPVELAAFNAAVNGSAITLSWKTVTEINNARFEVERKIDAQSWKLIGSVNGKGTTTEINEYLFTDQVSGYSELAYRLKQVDFDGTFTYSKVIELSGKDAALNYELSQNYPNPFNPTTKISYSLPIESRVVLSVYTITGELVSELVNAYQSAGTHNVEFNASELSNGIYIFKIHAGNFIQSRKMILAK